MSGFCSTARDAFGDRVALTFGSATDSITKFNYSLGRQMKMKGPAFAHRPSHHSTNRYIL
jgi:hypothetical protein